MVRDLTTSVDPDLIDAINDEIYKDKRHLSTREFEEEPWEAIWMARTVWSAQAKRHNKDISPRP